MLTAKNLQNPVRYITLSRNKNTGKRTLGCARHIFELWIMVMAKLLANNYGF